MPNIQIVTDSCAHFANPHVIQQSPVTVVPNKIRIGNKTFLEGVDLTSEEAIRLMSHDHIVSEVTSPSEAEFVEVYHRLATTSDAIISIHPSQRIYSSWENARAAAEQIVGHCEVVVVDSQTLSSGQAMLVRVAMAAIEQEATVEDVVRRVRGTVERIYSVYYVETVNSLLRNKIMSSSHAILGAMLGIKPFLTIENGFLTPMEKVRTRAQAVERLVEFVIEFTDIDDVMILQHKPHMSEQTRMIQDRLALEFPNRHFPYTLYNPSLAALIGTDATGVVILESEMEDIDDGF
jgi:DegV family protein with EDD domain